MGASVGGASEDTPILRIRLLGALDLRWSGTEPIELDSARAGSLLAYLVLHRDAPQPRQQIAYRLWPDSTESQSRTNLRHVLHNLRRRLPAAERYLQITQQTLRWRPDGPYDLDVAAFEQAVAVAATATDDRARIAALRAAVDVYRGDLLEGHYEGWLDAERARLRSQFLDGVQDLIRLLHQHGEFQAAVGYAELHLRHDPLAEQTYRLLMRMYAARSDRARAVRTYHTCAAVLSRELGVEPTPVTKLEYESLLVGADRPARSTRRVPSRAPLIGRAAERRQLIAAWHSTTGIHRARLILITGEPGIGKTRLLEEFRAWSADHRVISAYARAYQAEGPLAYGLVATWLRTPPLARRLHELPSAQLTELARLLPELLEERPDLTRPEALPAAEQRQRLFDAGVRALSLPDTPLLLVGDDLQWADRETVRFLHYLLRAHHRGQVLVAATARREELDADHPLTDLLRALRRAGAVTELGLARFTPQETAELGAQLLGRELEPAEQELLHTETEGNPLFVVEAIRAGWRGADSPGIRLSNTVRSVIASRLARLSPGASELVGVAATVGRDFSSEVLASAAAAHDEQLVADLDELWRRGIVQEHGTTAYDFTHDKIREVVYGALAPAQRRLHHRRIADTLVRLHPSDPAPVSGQVAVHLERAGAMVEAVDWYMLAAEAAHLLPAQAEVVRILDHAYELLRDRRGEEPRELAVLTALVPQLAVVESTASPRLVPLLERAFALGTRLGREPAPEIIRWLAVASLARGGFGQAKRLGAQLASVGERHGDDVIAVEADYVLAITAFWQGQLEAAQRHFQAAVDRFRVEDRTTHLLRFGLDPQVVCLSRLANTWWFLGDAGEAIRARDAALTCSAETPHPASHGTALAFAALLAIEMRDSETARNYVAPLRRLTAEHPVWAIGASSRMLGHYVDVLDGNEREGIAWLQEEVARFPGADTAPGARAAHLRILLAACAAAGNAEAGLSAADQALDARDGVTLWAAEARRMRAESLATLGTPAVEVTAELERAWDVANHQGATLLGLRVLTTLVRLTGDSSARSRLESALAALPAAAGTPDHEDALVALGRGRLATMAARPATPNARGTPRP